MNRKGVFLTFMVFLLIGAALALNLVLRQSSVREEKNIIDESAFREVNETFNSIYSQVLEDREGAAAAMQQRILTWGEAPGGGDSFKISQTVPPAAAGAGTGAVDALNLITVFIKESEINQGLQINAYIPDAFNAKTWGGSVDEPEIGYLIQPYCVRYLPLKSNTRLMGFEIPYDWQSPGGGTVWKTWGCEQPFDISNVKSINVDFFIGFEPSPELVNGNPACQPNNSFRAGGGNCYTDFPIPAPTCDYGYCFPVTVNFFETTDAAGQCYLGAPAGCTATVKGYLDIGEKTNLIKLPVSSGNIFQDFLDDDDLTSPSPTTTMYLFEFYSTNINSLQSIVDAEIEFIGPARIDLAGFEFSASKLGFDYCRKTKWGTCPGETPATCRPPMAIPCPLTAGVCAAAYRTCTIDGTWPECPGYGSNYEAGTELTCAGGLDNDCDGKTDCLDSDCYTKAVCCLDGFCRTSENCPQDALLGCTEQICRTATCTSGCGYSFIAAGGQDMLGSILCNNTTGCAPIPCECNGAGTCRSKCGNGYCDTGETVTCSGDCGYY